MTAHAHAREAEAIEGCGCSLPFQRVRERIGKGGDKLLWELLGVEERSAEGKHLSQLKKRIFHARYLNELAAFPAVAGAAGPHAPGGPEARSCHFLGKG